MKRIGITQSLMTLANASCGFVAITLLLGSGPVLSAFEVRVAAVLILLGLLFDTLDGRIARMTKLTSAFGRELDSLADVVTFGVAPAVLAKYLMDVRIHAVGLAETKLSLALSLLYLICAVLRLARFNADPTEEEDRGHGFFGLPTPGAAGMVASLGLLYIEKGTADILVAALPYIIPILGILMVSRIPYSHVGSLVLRGRRPFAHLLKIVFLGVLASLVLVESVFVGFVVYMLSGPVMLAWNWVVHREGVEEKTLF
jgi:CDP-diacylglycerol--serine O-phosphatidyltransferase